MSIYCSERDKETHRDMSLPFFLLFLDGVSLLLKKTSPQHIGWKERERETDRETETQRDRETETERVRCNQYNL